MDIPLNQPKGGVNDKRLRSRGGAKASDFPPSNVVAAPLNRTTD